MEGGREGQGWSGAGGSGAGGGEGSRGALRDHSLQQCITAQLVTPPKIHGCLATEHPLLTQAGRGAAERAHSDSPTHTNWTTIRQF